jgi:hypothetical protein
MAGASSRMPLDPVTGVKNFLIDLWLEYLRSWSASPTRTSSRWRKSSTSSKGRSRE